MSLFYPRHCEACGHILFRHEEHICNLCQVNLPRTNFHLLGTNPLEQMLAGRVPVKAALAFLSYEKSGRAQRLLHAIKYHGQRELGAFIGQIYGSELKTSPVVADVEVIVPIPLHRKKLKTRGYNQSEWFAKGLGTALERPLNSDCLVRVANTSTQTRKQKYQRWENVEGIFALERPEVLKGKHVLLVDDVITTGATLEAAWLALKMAEKVEVSVLSIAFAAPRT